MKKGSAKLAQNTSFPLKYYAELTKQLKKDGMLDSYLPFL